MLSFTTEGMAPSARTSCGSSGEDRSARNPHNLREEDGGMSIPVITLTPDQIEQVRHLRAKLQWFKEQSAGLEQSRKKQQQEFDELLHQVALSNTQYREWAAYECGSSHGRSATRY